MHCGKAPEWGHLTAWCQHGPEFATDAGVGERHGNERKYQDEKTHVELVEETQYGGLPVLETPVTDPLYSDLLQHLHNRTNMSSDLTPEHGNFMIVKCVTFTCWESSYMVTNFFTDSAFLPTLCAWKWLHYVAWYSITEHVNNKNNTKLHLLNY